MTQRGIPGVVAPNRSRQRRGLIAAALFVGACGASVEPGDGKNDDEPGPMGGMGGMKATGGAGGRGGAGGGGGDSVTPPPPDKCTMAKPPGATPLLKLTSLQYRNTVNDLLKASGVAMIADDVKALLSSVPEDSTPSFDGLDNRITTNHVNAFFNVASTIADGITSKPERLTAVAGACATATPLAPKCVDDFIASFGRRALRHKLTTEEVAFFKGLDDGKSGAAETFRSIILAMLTSPRFLNHFEIDGAPVAKTEDYLALSGFEIANRLSYTFWQSMPDEALLQAATDGSIATEAGFGKQLDRVYADPRTKETLWQFWNQWLRFDHGFFGFSLDRPAFKNLVAGLGLTEANKGQVYKAMVDEIRALTEYVAFDKKGSLSDLLSTDVSLTKSPELARIYNTQVWSGSGEPPRITDKTRNGLLTRAALLVIGEEQTNPFHRGATVRKRLLCGAVPSPDPNMLPPGSLEAPKLDPMSTTRQRFEGKMLPECRGCHGQFNDIGYVLEAYDSVGRYRTTEKIFDSKGAVLPNELPIDLKGVPKIDLADERPVNGPAELVQRIVESKTVDACMSKNFFEYALRRAQVDGSGDACAVEELVTELRKPGVSLGDVYKRLALQASFRLRKVGAQ